MSEKSEKAEGVTRTALNEFLGVPVWEGVSSEQSEEELPSRAELVAHYRDIRDRLGLRFDPEELADTHAEAYSAEDRERRAVLAGLVRELKQEGLL